MGKGVVRRVGQRLRQRRLGYCEMPGTIVGLKPGANWTAATKTIASTLLGSSAKDCSKTSRACLMYSGANPLFQQALPWNHKSMELGCNERSALRASAAMS